MPAIKGVLKTNLHKAPCNILKKIQLSNNTVQRCIDEMGHEVENYLCNYLQTYTPYNWTSQLSLVMKHYN